MKKTEQDQFGKPELAELVLMIFVVLTSELKKLLNLPPLLATVSTTCMIIGSQACQSKVVKHNYKLLWHEMIKRVSQNTRGSQTCVVHVF